MNPKPVPQFKNINILSIMFYLSPLSPTPHTLFVSLEHFKKNMTLPKILLRGRKISKYKTYFFLLLCLSPTTPRGAGFWELKHCLLLFLRG